MNELFKRMLDASIERGLDVVLMKTGRQPPLLAVEGYEGEAHQAATFSYAAGPEPEHVVVPVSGAFVWRPRKGDWYCGPAVDTESLTLLVDQLAANDKVESVEFRVDSPGGDARGIAELHASVNALAEAKPTTAVNVGDMCSAAYYGFCGADRVLSENPNAYTGSIGCYSVLVSYAQLLQKIGIDVELVSSGGVKGHGLGAVPISAEYREQHQISVNEIAEQFRGAVLATRSDVKTETAFNGFHWMHNKALELGLVDGLYSEHGDNGMDENKILAALNAIQTSVQATQENVVALSSRVERIESKNAPLSPELELVIELGQVQGRVTAANLQEVRRSIAGKTVAEAREVVGALTPVTKTSIHTDPSAGDSDEPVEDPVAEAFGGLIDSATVAKFKGANSFSLVDRCVREVGANQSHKKGRLIERAKPARKIEGAVNLDKAMAGVG